MNELLSESDLTQVAENPAAPAEPGQAAAGLAIPAYLEKVYWWAYIHPNAVRVFEREWLVNLILFNNYAKLRNAALREIGDAAPGATLQVACVYGDLTPRVRDCIAADGALHVVDVLPIQLHNLRRKLPPDARVALFQRDSAALGFADASYERALLFFLLHEQPEGVRRRTLAEVYRVTKPGGTIILVDYHRPHPWNPVRHPLQALLRRLEPFADDLWQRELVDYFPADAIFSSVRKETFFGGLYQKVVLTR